MVKLTPLTKEILKLFAFLALLSVINQLIPDVFIFNSYIKTSFFTNILLINFSIILALHHLENSIYEFGTPITTHFKLLKRIENAFLLSLYFFGTSFGIYYISNLFHNYVGADDPLIYFYDEILGHFLMYMSLAIAIYCLIIIQFYYPIKEKMSQNDFISLSILAIPMSLILSYALIEGQSVLLGFLNSIFSSFLIFYFLQSLKQEIHKYPFIYFILVLNIVIFLFLALYGWFYGGWPQPSSFLE